MNPVWVIAKKRDGHQLSAGEIRDFLAGYVSGEIPDYQMSALAMAIYLCGMTTEETATLTESMLNSGIQLQWPDKCMPIVDKHSTGGIGDKVSIVLAPMLACCGLQVPMLSGRGLGATGGTLDKLESIPGFRTDLSVEELQRQVEQVGCVITGTTENLVPADRKLYALRDVTATVPSIPLITASIMSKKLAEGLDALVLDVKFGSGAFMKTIEDARALAKSMVATGERMGVATTALLTDMNQPLGRMIGNAVEIDESVAALQGNGPDDLMEVTLALGTEALVSAGVTKSKKEAHLQLEKTISSGEAYDKLAEMVKAQGGELDAARKVAPKSAITATRSGYIRTIDAERIGQAVISMGGGRRQMGDVLDLSTGFEMQIRLGDLVEAGQPLASMFVATDKAKEAQQGFLSAIEICDELSHQGMLIAEQISESGI